MKTGCRICCSSASASGNPGVDRICYYLFDRDGKFEQGGLYDGGHNMWARESVELDAGKKRLTWHIDYMGGNRHAQVFARWKQAAWLWRCP